MPQTLLDISMSLDGFIADQDGGDGGLHAWLFAGDVPVHAGGMTFRLTSQASADVFASFVDSLGAFVIGARAFANIGESPPFGLPTFVVTHSEREPMNKGAPICFVTAGVRAAIDAGRAAAGAKNLGVFGGADIARQCLQAGVIDELRISLVPKLLGSGIPLFTHGWSQTRELECTAATAGSGVNHLAFRVRSAGRPAG